jgi:simple sugar transport system permease protein/ribose transport system permease protein
MSTMSSTAATTTPAIPRPRGRTLVEPLAYAGVLTAVLTFLLTTSGFATSDNLKAILLSSSLVGMLAIGQTLIMISGSFFSLSLGTSTAVSAMVFLWGLQYGVIPAILLAVAFGAAVSAVQGLPVGAWAANPIVMTIGGSVVLTGVVVLITNGSTVRPSADAPSINFLVRPVAGIPIGFYVLVVATILAEVMLRRGRLGHSTYLVGESRAAARAAGLPVGAVITGVFALAGACGAIAGILAGAVQGGATFSIEGTLAFDAIAATLVGGCAVAGGRGSVLRTLAGTLGIAAISSALLLRGYAAGTQILVKGVIVFAVVLFVHLKTRSRA